MSRRVVLITKPQRKQAILEQHNKAGSSWHSDSNQGNSVAAMLSASVRAEGDNARPQNGTRLQAVSEDTLAKRRRRGRVHEGDAH